MSVLTAGAGVSQMSRDRIAKIQERLTEKCMAVLLGYRRLCAANAQASQVCWILLRETSEADMLVPHS